MIPQFNSLLRHTHHHLTNYHLPPTNGDIYTPTPRLSLDTASTVLPLMSPHKLPPSSSLLLPINNNPLALDSHAPRTLRLNPPLPLSRIPHSDRPRSPITSNAMHAAQTRELS
jgi:hypothetical protein